MSLYRLFITWFYLVLFLGFFVGTICNVSLSVRDGEVRIVSTSTSADADYFQEAGADRNASIQTARHPVTLFFIPLLPHVPHEEGAVFQVPLCSFFLSDTFYVFLTSLAP